MTIRSDKTLAHCFEAIAWVCLLSFDHSHSAGPRDPLDDIMNSYMETNYVEVLADLTLKIGACNSDINVSAPSK
jgi:hypothetical protein